MRRRLVSGLLALVLGTVVLWGADPAAAGTSATVDKLHTTTPIKHFLVLMQAAHSFDNYFGTYPGADGIPSGTCMPAPAPSSSPAPAPAPSPSPSPAPGVPARCISPFSIGGQAVYDLGPSKTVHDAEYDNGKMDGFVSAFKQRPGVGGQPMGHYGAADIPFYWNVADNYVLFDRNFASASGGSVWNHMYWVTGTPGNTKADALSPAGFDAVPTIFDSLQKAGISWKFYAENYRPNVNFHTAARHPDTQLVRIPLLNYNRFLDDPNLRDHIVDMNQYYQDAQDGNLPAVSFMVPSGSGEHPPANIQAGQRFVSSIVNALVSSSSWRSSAFMWSYDSWGGWYDHVKPPAVDAYGYGFRTPALLVSPYARRGFVDHTTLDFTSQLKFIENNWGLAPLAARDKAANDITSAFDFNASPRAAVLLDANRSSAPPRPPRTSVVYPSYGAALLALPVLVLIALLRRRKVQTGVAQ